MAIIQAVGFTIGMGSGSVASRLLGQGLPGRAAVIASSAVVSALVCGGLLTLAGLLSLERFVWILGPPRPYTPMPFSMPPTSCGRAGDVPGLYAE